MINFLFEKIEQFRIETRSAGTKFRLLSLKADIDEVAQAYSQEVLTKVSHEAVLDADVDIDFNEMSMKVLNAELGPRVSDKPETCQLIDDVNESLGELHNVLSKIAEQLERRHKDDEYIRCFENEKKRYMSSGTAHRARQTFEQWKNYEFDGKPQIEDIEDYRLEKLLKLFKKDVLSSSVEHIQRAKHYQGEIDFDQLDDDNPLKKTAYRHYAALRKIVDFKDGNLVVNPIHMGRHFYACRKEPNAKANRTNLLKYMHKITLAQQEYSSLNQIHTVTEESAVNLPDVLATGVAMKYWERLQKAEFVDDRCQLLATTSRKQAMYIADVFSDKLQMRSKWKPFQELWHINNLAQEKWDMQETGKKPVRSEEIDEIFGVNVTH